MIGTRASPIGCTLVLHSLVALVCAVEARAAEPVTPMKCWAVVAASDVVVEATFTLGHPLGASGTVSPWLEDVKWIKGSGSHRLPVQSRIPLSVPSGAIVVAFVQRHPPAYYVTEHALRPECPPVLLSSSELVRQLTEEVRRQEAALVAYPERERLVRATARYASVRREMEALVRGRAEAQAIFDRHVRRRDLQVVPALVAFLDDERPIPKGDLEIEVRGGFEPIAHYTARSVSELAAMLLQELTDLSFGHPFGASYRDRISSAWRVYLMYTAAPAPGWLPLPPVE